ncbi:unnamed protein product [Cyprideis torosa]|uniref:Uncharacterized protein n=1 Tax=Cyprideis torosa TaxID=163714 RepID=A0A7R8WS34_9CRUS|nr:unnamed protein product [Cyprideis torosa]CAG0908764.1 unnamed protein product [Cyprideis torosa]
MVVPECIVSRDNQLGEVEFYHEFSRDIGDQFTTSTISIDVTAPFLPDKPCMPNPFDNGLLVACTKCRLTDSRFYPDVNLVSMLTCPAAVGEAAQLDEDDW